MKGVPNGIKRGIERRDSEMAMNYVMCGDL